MEHTFKILRFDPLKDKIPYFQDFIHTPNPKDSVLEALKDIRDHQDPSLSFRYSCREAVCGSCAMVINGDIALSCRTTVESLDSPTIVIEPLPNLKQEKDLMVDMAPFFEALRFVEPYLQAAPSKPEEGFRIEDKDMDKIYQYINCIMCGSCYAACPVASRDEEYLGPAALAKLYRFLQDPRDERAFSDWKKVDSQDGIWGCDTVFRCNEVCPKDVRPADGILGLRRKMAVEKTKRIFKKDK